MRRPRERKIQEVNMSTYVFDAQALLGAFPVDQP